MPVSTTNIFPTLDSGTPWGWAGLDWSVTKSPMFSTLAPKTRTGRSARTAQYATPLWHFKLTWNLLRDDGYDVVRNGSRSFPANEYETLLGFYLQQLAGGIPFFYTDPTDNKVTGEIITSSANAGTDFRMLRTFGRAGAKLQEPVGGINESASMTVRVNGGSVSFTKNTPYDGWIRLASPASAGATIDWDGSYYFRCVFAKDTQEFETFMKNFWQAKTIELESVKGFTS